MRSAKVAKLVDAPGLGPDALTGVRVRVPPFAPFCNWQVVHLVTQLACFSVINVYATRGRNPRRSTTPY